MLFRDMIHPQPGVRRLSLLRRAAFGGSAQYWERNYAKSQTSWAGSYGALAHDQTAFLNEYVRTREIGSVIEFGCDDGSHLSLAYYPAYISRTAIKRSWHRFAADSHRWPS